MLPSLTFMLPFLPPILLFCLHHFPSLFSFMLLCHLLFFLRCSVLPLYLCFSPSLLPLSSFPRGYYLSRRQICPIINLISPTLSLLRTQIWGFPAFTAAHTPSSHRYTEAEAQIQLHRHKKTTSLFFSSSLSISLPPNTHTHIHTHEQEHHPSPPPSVTP